MSDNESNATPEDETAEAASNASANETTGDEPEIHVDEDWKSQVEAEREAAEQQAGPQDGSQSAEPSAPPASLELLITTMAAQGVSSLGLAPDPMTQKSSINLSLAKFHIDMLTMLEEKTEGNRSEAEEELLGNTLHELRMLYVAVSKSPEKFAAAGGDQDDAGPSIVTP